MLELFQLETSELISELDHLILELEKTKESSSVLNSVARILHTLKGAAATVDCQSVKEFVHAAEDYINVLKTEAMISSEYIDYVFTIVDWIKYLIELAVQESPAPDNLSTLCSSVKKGVPLPEITNHQIASSLPKNNDVDNTAAEPVTDEPHYLEQIQPLTITNKGISSQLGESQRIQTKILDNLLNLSGELYVKGLGIGELKESMLQTLKVANSLASGSQFLSTSSTQSSIDREIKQGIDSLAKKSADLKNSMEPLFQQMDEFSMQLQYLTSELQDEVMAARMVPLSQLFDLFPRMVRDLAKSLGKQIELVFQGEKTLIDKAIIESLKTPMEHLLRNAIDHGIASPQKRIEQGKSTTGKLTISAYHQGDQVVIHVKDDGQGIDPEIIRTKITSQQRLSPDKAQKLIDQELLEFIFLPGFSTQDQVTEVSGRGVGMDIVKTQIEKLNGQIRIQSRPGQFTQFTITLPLTLAVTQTLIFEAARQLYAFPTSTVGEYIHVQLSDIKQAGGKPVIEHNEQIMAVAWLHQLMEYPTEENQILHRKYPGLLFKTGEEQVVILGNRLVAEEEVVIKPLDPRFKKIKNIMGATILNTGRIALVVDISDLLNMVKDAEYTTAEPQPTESSSSVPSILVVEDSLTIREIERKILKSAGYDVVVAVDGVDGLNKTKGQRFDLIITDIDMPRMNGLELTKTLKEDPKYQHIPIVIVSYKDRPEDKRKGLEVGADQYITKSQFDNNEFLETIHRLI